MLFYKKNINVHTGLGSYVCSLCCDDTVLQGGILPKLKSTNMMVGSSNGINSLVSKVSILVGGYRLWFDVESERLPDVYKSRFVKGTGQLLRCAARQ